MPSQQSADGAPAVTVEASGVSRSFGDVAVIHDLDLSVAPGTIHGLIGPSGSGKTTTVRMLTGYLQPDAGTVRIFGSDVDAHDTATRQRIGYMPQLGVLYPELSVRENLLFVASLYGVRNASTRIEEVLRHLDLAGTESQALGSTSGGMQRRVALAGALLHEPDLLFLDEPTSGLDPRLRRQVWSHFQALRDDGRTLVVTTQIVSEATMCDTVGLIVEGRLVAVGTPAELRRRAEGGDVVDVQTSSRIPPQAIGALQQNDVVRKVSRNGENALRLVVADAEIDLPALDSVMADAGLDRPLAERYVRPFEDVFVTLLEQDDA